MQHARDRVREITARERLLLPIEVIVQDLNQYLRGWAGYFRYGNSARHFNLIEHHAHNRLGAVQWPNATIGRGATAGRSLHFQLAEPPGPDQPRRNRRRAQTLTGPGEGDSRMPAVKNVGEPCAGEPHARFEVAAGGNQTSRASTRRAVQAPLADPT